MKNKEGKFQIFTDLTQLLRANVEREDILFLLLAFVLIKNDSFDSLQDIRNILAHPLVEDEKKSKLKDELTRLLRGSIEVKEFYTIHTGNLSDNMDLNDKISDKFRKIIDDISTVQFFRLVQSFVEDTLNENDLPQIIELVREYISENSIKSNQGYYGGGKKLGNLIRQIVKIEDGQVIYDPAAGKGISSSFLELKSNNSLILQDISQDNLLLGKLFWLFQSFIPDFIQGDSLTSPFPEKNSVDIIISELPFGKGRKYSRRETGFDIWFDTDDFTSLFILQAIHVLKDNGKAYLLIGNNFLFSSGKLNRLRRAIVEFGVVESVISLPNDYLPGLDVKSSLLILNRNKPESRKESIHFVDLNAATEVGVSLPEIADVICDFSSTDYAKSIDMAKIIKSTYNILATFHLEETEITYGLNERLTELGRLIKRTKIRKEKSDKLPYIQIKHLSDEIDLLELDVSSAKINPHKKGMLVDFPALLVAKIGHQLKPTIYNGEGEGIIVDRKVFVLEVNQNEIIPEFLAYELRKPYCKKQMKKFQTGAVVPSWSRIAVLSVKIRMPNRANQEKSLHLQRDAISEFQETVLREQQDEYKVLEKKLQDETQEKSLEILGNFRHNFGNRMERLSSNIKLLKEATTQKGFYDSPIFSDEEVTIGDKLEQLEKAVIDSIDEAKAMYEEVVQDRETFSFEEINIQSFILKMVNGFKGTGNFSIEFSLTNEFIQWKESNNGTAKVNIAKQKFQKIFENLISNAEKHAFTNFEKKNYEILFELGIDLVNNAETICLSYKDNGEGFPTGADKNFLTERGKKAGNNRGTGIGGNQIHSIIKKHGGQFEIIQIRPEEDITSPYSVIYNIHLPRI